MSYSDRDSLYLQGLNGSEHLKHDQFFRCVSTVLTTEGHDIGLPNTMRFVMNGVRIDFFYTLHGGESRYNIGFAMVAEQNKGLGAINHEKVMTVLSMLRSQFAPYFTIGDLCGVTSNNKGKITEKFSEITFSEENGISLMPNAPEF